jgi:hypothetical protein
MDVFTVKDDDDYYDNNHDYDGYLIDDSSPP